MVDEEKETQEETGKEETKEEESQEQQKKQEESSSKEQEEQQEKEKEHEDTVPYDRFEEANTKAREADERAAETNRRLNEAEQRNWQVRDEDAKTRFDADFDKDPLATTKRLADERAYNVLEYEQSKADAVEEAADSNPKYAKYEREIKRKMRTFYPQSKQELEDRVKLEFQAAIGRESGKREVTARKQGKDDAIKEKKVIGPGNATGTTTSKSDKGSALNEEETTFAAGMGLSQDKIKEAAKKGRVVE